MVGGNVPDIICPLESYKCNVLESFHILDIVWVWCEVSTCFTDPIHVTIHLLLQLLFFFQQQETSSTFYSVFFFCKLTEKLLLKLVHLNTDKSFYIAKINSTYPLSTPRTRFNIKKEPTTISGIKKTQLNTVPRASFV